MNHNKQTLFDIECGHRAPLAAQLATFERHKQTLIGTLRNARGDRHNSNFLDEEDAWGALTRAARWFFRRPQIKQKTLLSARRVERLRDLAKALARTRRMFHEAMHNDVRWDLIRGWCAEANIPPASAHVLNQDGSVEFPIADQINEVVAGLVTAEAAASRAARDVPTKAGAPRGTGILTPADIAVLAGVYQRSTGQKPTIGAGPFAQFVEEFLIAVGRGDDTSQDYVVEAFKYARKQGRKKPGR